MKLKLSELPVGNCYAKGKSRGKKVAEDRVAFVGAGGKVRTRAVKGDPEVSQRPCRLDELGVGLRRHPEEVVEIGDGRPRSRGPRSRHEGRR